MGMASSSAKLSYQRLKQEIFIDEGYIHEQVVVRRSKNFRFRRLRIRRKLRVKTPRLKRFLRTKPSLVKIVWSKICKRLKESQTHFGDLFAGNYLFMHVTPTPIFKCAADNGRSFVKNHGFHGLSSPRYYVPRIAS